MDRFKNLKNYLSNINSSVLLAIGLVIVAGLIAATFIYGETEDGNGPTANNSEEVTNDGDPENDDQSEAQASEEESSTEDNGQEGEEEASDEQQRPQELADTGPAASALAVMSLSTAGYFYRRSQKNLESERENN